MIRLREISNSITESKKLRVFDFDDTLVTTNSHIYVRKSNGGEFKLTPGEFAVYEPKAGEEFDFRDFHSLIEPKLIKGYFKLLQRMVFKGGNRGVFILTARPTYRPIKNFIRDLGLKNVYVVALGSSNPEDKADWIENQVIKYGYDDVYFVDDSLKNVKAVDRRLQKYPNVKRKIQHINHG